MLDEITRPHPLRTLVAIARLTDRERMVRMLDRAGGYDIVAETGDGRSAVRLSGQVDPDLVLLDAGLPEVDGIDATAAILHNVPSATVVVLTPGGSDAAGVLAVRYGARSHVPLDSAPEVLLAAVAAALALPRELTGRQSRTSQAGIAAPSWWETMLEG